MVKLNHWLESIFFNSNEKTAELTARFFSLANPKEVIAVNFAKENLGEAADWQFFIYMLFRSTIQIRKVGLDLTDNDSFIKNIDEHSYAMEFIKAAGIHSKLAQVIISCVRASVEKDKKLSKKLFTCISISEIPFHEMDALRKTGIHWRILEQQMLNDFIEFSLKTLSTHNPRDLDCSISSALAVNKSGSSDHPFIGFTKGRRISFPAGSGGAGNAFIANICSLTIASEDNIFSFRDYFNNGLIANQIKETGITPESFERISNACHREYGDTAPDSIDSKLKQIYWIGDDETLLITPLIASSLQCDLIQFNNVEGDIELHKRRSVFKYVKRIFSNSQNGSVLMEASKGIHYLASCLPPQPCEDSDSYYKFYRALDGKFAGYVSDKMLRSINDNLALTYRNRNIEEGLAKNLALASAAIIKNIVIARDLAIRKGEGWVNAKQPNHELFSLFKSYVFGTSKKETIPQLAQAILSQVSSAHLSDEVIRKLRPHVEQRLEEAV